MKISEFCKALDKLYPLVGSEEYCKKFNGFDNSGLLVCGDTEGDVSRALICLDVTREVIAEAKAKRCELILSHHPTIYYPISNVSQNGGASSKIAAELLTSGIANYCCHFPMDLRFGTGINWEFAKAFGAPDDSVCVEALGDGSTGDGMLRVWNTEAGATLADFIRIATEIAGVEEGGAIKVLGNADMPVKRVGALNGGAGSWDYVTKAIKAGCDLYISGDFPHHVFADAARLGGIALIGIDHYDSEKYCLNKIGGKIKDAMEKICGDIKNVEFMTSQKERRPFSTIRSE